MSGVAAASAQTSNWATVTSIHDLTGNQSLLQSDPQVAGHTYNVTMTIDVPAGSAGAAFRVSLNPNVTSSGSQYWYLQTPGYAGYNRSTFTSSLRSVQFDWVAGTVVLSALYTIPLNLTTVNTEGLALHFTRGAFALVQIVPVPTPPGVSLVGSVVVTVEDQSIQTYLTQYQADSALISSGKVSSSYSTLMDGVLSLSQSLYKAGLTEQATALLNDVSPSDLPAPPSSSYVSYILAAAVVLAVVAACLAILWVRGRGKSGYASGVINQTNRELASLEVVAGRYDKTLADQLKALRDKLAEASD